MLFLLFSCGDSKFFSTENSIVFSDNNNPKSINNYMLINNIPELKTNISSDYYELDYQGYNLLYDENSIETTFNKKKVYLFKGKIFINQNVFMMDDIYSSINLDEGTEGYNRKILLPISILTSEEILNANFIKDIYSKYPKFKEKMLLVMFKTENNGVEHYVKLYFSSNKLLKIDII